MTDAELIARALVAAAGLPASERELEELAARYATMREMAADLRGFIDSHDEQPELLPDLRGPA
jgi:uncharacterized protein YbjT (DUF2867 family)